MNLLGYRAFTAELIKIATEVQDADIRAMMAEAKGKEYLPGGQIRSNAEVETNFKPKLAMGFMGYTPPSAYNWLGKKPTATGTPYETASNFASAALKGGMTGAGAATLAHTLHHGHDFKIPPKHLGKAVALGSGVALADRALRRRAVIKQQKMKTAMLGSSTFTPARALQTGQQQGHFENKLHRGVVKSMPGMIGRESSAPQGV